MKNNKEIEAIILEDSEYEDLIDSRKEKEFTDILSSGVNISDKEISDITLVPKELLFSKHCTYYVINKNSKTKSYINGIQADGFLAGQNTARQNLLSGKSDYFISGNNYIKFYKSRI